MSAECSICLAAFREPVSIPCGHIYCTKCLSDHVNSLTDESLKSTCPTCRTPFSLVTPDLTYLPKKYHQYVIPSVRRVYLDTTRQTDLGNKLSAAKARIKKLEKDEETLLRQCERHMAAARAHAEKEREALREIDLLCNTLKHNEKEYTIEKKDTDQAFEEMKAERDNFYRKYQDLKKRHSDLKRKQNEADKSNTSLSASQGYNNSRITGSSSSNTIYVPVGPDTTVDHSGNVSLIVEREIRPMPLRSRIKGRTRPVSPPPMFGGSIKRQRISTE